MNELREASYTEICRVLITARYPGAQQITEKAGEEYVWEINERSGHKPKRVRPYKSSGWREMLERYQNRSEQRHGFEKEGPMRLPVKLVDGAPAEFMLTTYEFGEGRFYDVLALGDIKKAENLLVRIQSACRFPATFHSTRCDCGAQTDLAMLKIAQEKAGVMIYVWAHEGRGVGMMNHTRVYMEQDRGEDTVSSYEKLGLPVDSRDYSDIIEILRDLGLVNGNEVGKIRLLTNNPSKIEALERAGVKVERVRHVPLVTGQSDAKIEKLGHFPDILEPEGMENKK